MARRYSQVFTLNDIFNNKALKKRLPFINYKEKVLPNGKISRTTHGKTVNRLIFDTAVSSARPYYKPLNSHRAGDELFISGTLVAGYDTAYSAVYEGINGIKELIEFTANNADMIRSAMKEAEKNKRRGGIDSPLFLRVQSIEQIQHMSHREINSFMNNVMENLMFSDNFAETQAKFGVQKWRFRRGVNYDVAKREWELKVGANR